MNKLLFNYVVDEKMYEDFSGRTYTLDGKTVTLSAVEAALRGAESARKEEAIEIAAAIRKEIEKGYKQEKSFAAKHNDFAEYLTDVLEIEREAAKILEGLETTVKKARDRWKSDRAEKLSDDEMAIRKGEYLKAEENFKKSVAALSEETGTKLEEVKKEFSNHLRVFYFPDGSKIDDDVMKLFKADFPMAKDEIELLAEKFRDNPTMIRLIGKQASDRNVKTDRVSNLVKAACKGGASEREIFDFLSGKVLSAIAATTWGEVERRHFEKSYDKAVKEMSASLIKP